MKHTPATDITPHFLGQQLNMEDGKYPRIISIINTFLTSAFIFFHKSSRHLRFCFCFLFSSFEKRRKFISRPCSKTANNSLFRNQQKIFFNLQKLFSHKIKGRVLSKLLHLNVKVMDPSNLILMQRHSRGFQRPRRH